MGVSERGVWGKGMGLVAWWSLVAVGRVNDSLLYYLKIRPVASIAAGNVPLVASDVHDVVSDTNLLQQPLLNPSAYPTCPIRQNLHFGLDA